MITYRKVKKIIGEISNKSFEVEEAEGGKKWMSKPKSGEVRKNLAETP